MKINNPVTQQEYSLSDDVAIISHTDHQGRILFCNDDFVAASGFTREELIGQDHNIVRHPDMPAEAFRDMWATLQAGRPWSGIVKNRRKNGDHYWVRATATPQADGKGYMSVRIKASRQEIQQAEALYQRMRSNSRITLNEGRLHSSSWFAAIGQHFARWHVSTRLYLMSLFGGLLFVLAVAIGLHGMVTARDALKTVYEDRTVTLLQLGSIGGLIRENAIAIMRAYQYDPANPLAKTHQVSLSSLMEHIEQRKIRAAELWQAY